MGRRRRTVQTVCSYSEAARRSYLDGIGLKMGCAHHAIGYLCTSQYSNITMLARLFIHSAGCFITCVLRGRRPIAPLLLKNNPIYNRLLSRKKNVFCTILQTAYQGIGKEAIIVKSICLCQKQTCRPAHSQLPATLADALSKSFGKDEGFTVGLVLVNLIFLAILAFGDAKYLGPFGDQAAFQAMQQPNFDFDTVQPA